MGTEQAKVTVRGMRVGTWGLVWAMVMPWMGGPVCAEYSVTREAIVAQMSERVRLSAKLRQGLKPEERERLLAEVRKELAEAAREVLPETLAAGSKAEAEQSLATVLVMSGEGAYNRLAVRKSLMDVKINMGVQKATADVPEERAKAVEASIGQLVDGMKASMSRQLVGQFTAEEIGGHVEEMRGSMVGKIRLKTTYAMKRPMDGKAVEDFLSEFDERLAGSVGRIPKRLAEAERITDQQKRKAYVEGERRMMLMEITSAAGRFVASKTVDAEMAKLDVEQLAPGYGALIGELAQGERAAVEQEKRKREAELAAERTAKIERREVRPVLERTMAKLEAMGPEQPAGVAKVERGKAVAKAGGGEAAKRRDELEAERGWVVMGIVVGVCLVGGVAWVWRRGVEVR